MLARALASAALALAGCANNSATSSEYDDVAQMLGIALATPGGGGELATFADSARLARGTMPSGMTPDGGTMLGDHGGMSYRYLISCRDASGAVLGSCGAATASAHVIVDWSGAQHAASCDTTMTRSAAWSLAGLASPSASLTGSSSLTQDATFATTTGVMMSSYHVTASEQANLALDMASSAVIEGKLDLALSITHGVRDMHGTDQNDFAMHANVMFDGSDCTLVLDGSHAYAVDLATGEVTGAATR